MGTFRELDSVSGDRPCACIELDRRNSEDCREHQSPRAANAPCEMPTEQWPQQGRITEVLGACYVVFCSRDCLKNSSWSYKFSLICQNPRRGTGKVNRTLTDNLQDPCLEPDLPGCHPLPFPSMGPPVSRQ